MDFDIEKYFDTVNHDRLMTALARDCQDKMLLRLIRRYLRTGIMADGLISTRDEGTPQGSPLSPILSLIVLDELGRYLEKKLGPKKMELLEWKHRQAKNWSLFELQELIEFYKKEVERLKEEKHYDEWK